MSIFGKPKYGGGSNFIKRQYFKLKDGESTFRILPPIGNDGIWSKFYRVHYGYKNSKGEMRVFQSPLVKNNKTKMTESPDAALERIESFKAQFEEAKRTGNKALAEKLDKFVGQKGMYNLDSNHYVNAMDEQGNIGVLKLRHRCKVALDATIDALRAAGTDPLSAEDGRYFVFRRSGSGLDTHFSVNIKKEKLKVEGVGVVERDVVHVIDKAFGDRCAVVENEKIVYKEAANLSFLFKRPSSDEVKRIVDTTDVDTGRSSAIDVLFDSKKDEAVTFVDDSIEDETTHSTTRIVAPLATAKSYETSGLVATVSAPAAVSVAKTETFSAPKTTAQTVTNQSDEDFLKSLGV